MTAAAGHWLLRRLRLWARCCRAAVGLRLHCNMRACRSCFRGGRSWGLDAGRHLQCVQLALAFAAHCLAPIVEWANDKACHCQITEHCKRWAIN